MGDNKRLYPTKEEFMKEYERKQNRTPEEVEKEQQELYDKINKGIEEYQKRHREQQKLNNENVYGDCDHPNTMENSTATILYIIVMAVSIIFVDGWMVWIVASIIYFSFITRHKRRKIKGSVNNQEMVDDNQGTDD